MAEETHSQALMERVHRLERRCNSLRLLVMLCVLVSLIVIIRQGLPDGASAYATPPSTSPGTVQDSDSVRARKLQEQQREQYRKMQEHRLFQQRAWRKHKLAGAVGVKEAREFRIVDKEGRTRAILGLAPDDTVRLLMFDAEGRELLSAPEGNRVIPLR